MLLFHPILKRVNTDSIREKNMEQLRLLFPYIYEKLQSIISQQSDYDKFRYAACLIAFMILTASSIGMFVLWCYLGIFYPLLDRSNRDWLPYWKIFALLSLIQRGLPWIPGIASIQLLIIVFLLQSEYWTQWLHENIILIK